MARPCLVTLARAQTDIDVATRPAEGLVTNRSEHRGCCLTANPYESRTLEGQEAIALIGSMRSKAMKMLERGLIRLPRHSLIESSLPFPARRGGSPMIRTPKRPSVVASYVRSTPQRRRTSSI